MILPARTKLHHLPSFREPFSALSHLLGAALGATPLHIGFLVLYAFSCVLLFALSGVYHQMVRGGTAHRVMERLDHASLFVLIAGTLTAIHDLQFTGPLRWGSIVLVWAVAGITLKTVFFSG